MVVSVCHSTRLQSCFMATSNSARMSWLPTPVRRAASITYSSLRNNERVSPTAGHRNEYAANPTSLLPSHARSAKADGWSLKTPSLICRSRSYQPEVGRYGDGRAMEAAEAVFVADSHAVVVQARHLSAAPLHPRALAAVSMVDIVRGFLGPDAGIPWLIEHPVSAGTQNDRAAADQVARWAAADAMSGFAGGPGQVAGAWLARTEALAAYRHQLPADADLDTVLDSLLHMHHNRALGIDPDSERACRRMVRQAALAQQARQTGQAP